MRFCRYDDNRLGVVFGDQVKDVTGVLDRLPNYRYPFPHGDQFMAHFAELRPIMEEMAKTAPSKPLSDAALLSPIANPGKIVGAPVNYRLHLDEVLDSDQLHHGMKIKPIAEAGVFLKAVSSLVGPSEGVVVDWADRRTDHEIELAVIIGKKAFRVSEADALDYVAGYAICYDITIRGPEERSYRKSLDTFSVLGPYVVTADEIPNPNNLDFELTIGGASRQKSNTNMLIFNVQKLIEFTSKAYTLYPGDIIMTGTPEGVAPIAPGDVLHGRFEGIGTMDVKVYGNWDKA
ncbi:fumarylacetoacetate hydrolase family protein [Neorhizobium galegae]|uniref:fumarylacetoacetate hydrolase family protein n=1 Tax=Neorhizobium galegae TaxID=399 RepID=UPI000622A249|nr:fumarylacetoacetate hydrolase family protein [Neorhizobium galegae]CDZ56772.1 2-hydroxyhepta-2,4-diene-1,7-dioate isomerase [Neorhizobium galegae bv. orientalis]KAB1122835.1 fumarylacetoacetate hydrolase family protein [Neorhizobium galegae]MCQ1570184.1 fumarylacetoacetate hydrolase family protein [Neorhizobium galegae]MCQ1807718.1 fumarylacetoacetate hydrolase family protein [Neorhizobium galegae]MCQ1838288.1 fumarylacetoacetate hydrolase family protein [Neorhizobium galegae]